MDKVIERITRITRLLCLSMGPWRNHSNGNSMGLSLVMNLPSFVQVFGSTQKSNQPSIHELDEGLSPLKEEKPKRNRKRAIKKFDELLSPLKKSQNETKRAI